MSRSFPLISSARAKFFAFLAACLWAIRSSTSESRTSAFFSVMIPKMIDSEACDLFHNQIHPFVSFAVCCCTQVGIFRTENSVQYRGRCRLTVPTFIIKGRPCGYKIEFVNCQYLFSRSAPFNCQFILVSHSDLYYNNG